MGREQRYEHGVDVQRPKFLQPTHWELERIRRYRYELLVFPSRSF